MTAPEVDTEAGGGEPGFRVSLDGFDGPFDLLLTLIGKHELDITEVSLSLVTDEFISYLATIESEGLLALDQASEFLVVAATLLDMKIASLLPQGEVVDPEDMALLEARDHGAYSSALLTSAMATLDARQISLELDPPG